MSEKTKEVEVQELEKIGKPVYKFPFTMGADPEFTVVSGTRPMNAEDIFATFFKGLKYKKGPDGRAGGFQLPGGDIGNDSHPATGELRPNPGTPHEVVSNLKLLFGEAHKRMPFVDLTTLTVASATGGHIHLSVPEELNPALENKTAKWSAIERTVGMFIILIMMGENSLSRELRKRGSNYGDLLDFRYEVKFAHPSGARGYTMEIRGPTAEWITSEKIATGTLVYMAIAWDSILKGQLESIAPIMFLNKTQARNTVEPLVDNYGGIQSTYLNKMRPFIRKHEAYGANKSALELILNPARVIEEKKRVHYCINEGWGFTTNSKEVNTNKFMNDDEIEKLTSKFPEQIIRNLSQFAWNEDLHVEQFATALSKRCIALGWKPKHEYFLFGMKKGMDAIVMRNEEGQFLSGTEIMQTKEDYKLIEHKFGRLGKKATPVYGRVLNPRTGELTKEKDERRVMIGIPYGMRQKNDIKPLMRLVLSFEKNPKAYNSIELKSLPEGESKIKKAMIEDEEQEKGMNEAIRRGEQAQQIPQEIVEAAMELERETNPRTSIISLQAESIIDRKLEDLDEIWSRNSRTRDGATQMLEALIGHNNEWPGLPNSVSRPIIIIQLLEMLLEKEEGVNDEIIYTGRQQAVAYLLCAGMGQEQAVSLAPRSNGYTHRIRQRTENNTPRFVITTREATGAQNNLYELETQQVTARSARSASIQPILDLLGVSSIGGRGMIENALQSSQGNWFDVNVTIATENPEVAISGRRIIIRPNDEMPHVWNA
jgi:hypothetical protein